jgi:hypothetical protein
MTGFEYQAIAHMMYAGMVKEGIECFENIRRRYDGERRNPWDEAECGHHYARAMASWSAILALSGFQYDGGQRRVAIVPRFNPSECRSIWSTATGWGTFSHTRRQPGLLLLSLTVVEGELRVESLGMNHVPRGKASVTLAARPLSHRLAVSGPSVNISLSDEVVVKSGETLAVRV